jgi:glutamate/tyrosine decarboxylase-like PLP-dependent enzyme
MGMGSESVIKVPTDAQGRMKPDELRRLITESLGAQKVPFMVACTSGTTVFSAFDPLDQIRGICTEFGLWMHVDAALGGTVLFSPELRHLMKGVKGADSVTWNLHKMAASF